MPKFTVGQRVRRNPKFWPVGGLSETVNCGTVKALRKGNSSAGRTISGVDVLFDRDKGAHPDSWGVMITDRTWWYCDVELIAHA